jgi:Co/Zn/Cd efflux system component
MCIKLGSSTSIDPINSFILSFMIIFLNSQIYRDTATISFQARLILL